MSEFDGGTISLDALRERLRITSKGQPEGEWPRAQIETCRTAGVFKWFADPSWGGCAWTADDIANGYVALSSSCLKTAFVLTQRSAAMTRISQSGNEALKARLMPGLVDGSLFATVGISHLTTSRQHVKTPVMRCRESHDGYRFDGQTPWVTGAVAADWLVVGATLDDGRQILTACPAHAKGVKPEEPAQLLALSGSCTGAVSFQNVLIDPEWILAGPVENVMSLGVGGRTGGLQTTALALGLASSILTYMDQHGKGRGEIERAALNLRTHWQELISQMTTLAAGSTCEAFDNESLRRDANELVIKCSQVGMATAKGAGFISGHPVERWCREALFFLVWSCPQKVVDANVCHFAEIER